ncbi:MAG TPA: peptidase dimerization domain protein, partial [Chitinophagales bacterium]|nr:peptidase dimerization domain protein [Chitinophagales bacterium]
MDFINNYIETNKERLLDELFALLRIPSVSADPKYKADVARTAHAVADSLRAAGADNVRVNATEGHPIVTAEKIINPSLPTVLCYGH